jgi:hypothetical protein
LKPHYNQSQQGGTGQNSLGDAGHAATASQNIKVEPKTEDDVKMEDIS